VVDAEFGSFFLADPGAFPEAVEGSTWGHHQRLMMLPGGPFLITGLNASQVELMDREYSTVITETPPFDDEIHKTAIFREVPEFFREFDMRGWTYTHDIESTAKLIKLAGLNFTALVPRTTGETAGLWTSVEDDWFQGVIENYLRAMVAHRLVFCDGVLLHSAGAVIDGSAYLFVGTSGAGKSTLARKALESGSPVLSDDLNAVEDLSVKPKVAQLPFTGELRDLDTFDGAAPLRGIFLLNKGDAVICESLSRAQAIAAIMATSPYVNHGTDNLDSLMESLAILTAQVPVARLVSAETSTFEEIKIAIQRFQE